MERSREIPTPLPLWTNRLKASSRGSSDLSEVGPDRGPLTRFRAIVVITALRDETGELVGFAKGTRDLTERRQAQERAIAKARRLAEVEAASRAKSEFLTTLSHELRTPLNVIGGYADLPTMEVPGAINESQRQFLERIKSSQQHLLGRVNDLLNLFPAWSRGRSSTERDPFPRASWRRSSSPSYSWAAP